MPSREIKPYKELSKNLTIDDTAAALEMTSTILKNLGGRPCTYPNTTKGLETFIENSQGYFSYLQSCNSKLEEKAQIIPDIEGYCLWLGIGRTTLKTYSDRGGDWQKIIELFKNSIGYCKKQLMLKGRIPAVMGVFDLVNNHGYYNTNSFVIEHKAEADKEDLSEKLEEEVRAAGLIWDPKMKEFVPEEGR